MKLAIEKAIEEAAPEVIRIEVEGANQPAMASSFEAGLAPASSQPPAQEAPITSGEWVELRDIPEFAGGDLAATEAAGIKVIVCRVGESLYAYQDSCPSCAAALGGGALRASILTCPSCGRGYDVRRAGQCMDASALHMEPLPLLANQGGIRIAVPAMTA
jgi:nitrite reductase/ring-hydroxylating ferredoxin subunit